MKKYLQFHSKDFLLFIVLTIIEVYIALYVHDQFIRPFVGDILVLMVLYYFVKSFLRTTPKLLALYIFLFAAGIEILQYMQLVTLLHLENNVFMRILLGTTFDIWDIVAYGIGCLGLYFWQLKSSQRNFI